MGKRIPNYVKNRNRSKGGIYIPDPVSNVKSPVDPEAKKYTVGHEFYNESLCKIKVMDATPLRKVLENYKRISLCVTPAEIRKTLTDAKSVTKKDHYKKYFMNLSPDVDVLEFDASGHRGFFYLDTTRKVVNMIAIDVHQEDKKQTR